MDNGFFVICKNTAEVDYLRLAYGLALSIKLSQPKYNKISIAINSDTIVSAKHREIFDHISMLDPTDKWNFNSEYKSYWLSPYQNTIRLDSDMLLFNDLTNLWNLLGTFNYHFTPLIRGYDNEIIDKNKQYFYREIFAKNKLPYTYSAFSYFTKNTYTHDMYDEMYAITTKWDEYKALLRYGDMERQLTSDLLYGMVDEGKNPEIESFSFIHMKSMYIPGSENDLSSWMKMLPYYYTNENNLYIGNYKIDRPFHYYDKKFLTDQMILTMEKALGI